MTQTQAVTALIDDYFNLAYEPRSRDFHQIFHPSCFVQWLDGERLNILSSQDYAALIHGRPSPGSSNAPREEAILGIDHLSEGLSTARVKVRIGNRLFNDHFVLHKVEGRWLITTKASALVATFD